MCVCVKRRSSPNSNNSTPCSLDWVHGWLNGWGRRSIQSMGGYLSIDRLPLFFFPVSVQVPGSPANGCPRSRHRDSARGSRFGTISSPALVRLSRWPLLVSICLGRLACQLASSNATTASLRPTSCTWSTTVPKTFSIICNTKPKVTPYLVTCLSIIRGEENP